MRKPEDRNKPDGDVNEMLLFNEAISSLGLIELPLYGRKYTWTNKQPSPLLERLDWFFTSSSWTTSYPGTCVNSLVMQTSDYWPCNTSISTTIPKSQVFRFENYWSQQLLLHKLLSKVGKQLTVNLIKQKQSLQSSKI